MTEHHINVTIDGTYHDDDSFVATLECSDPEACPGWIECIEDHSGFDPEVTNEWEDVMIHGVLHREYMYGYGWVIDMPGCPALDIDWEMPDGIPMDRPGRYLVDTEWEDTDCWFVLDREVTA